MLKQWFLGITQYADRLHAGLDTLEWPQHVVDMQRQWIGRSEGFEFHLTLANPNAPPAGVGDSGGGSGGSDRDDNARRAPVSITAFTTRPDTVYGASFVAVSPSHPVLSAVAPEHTEGIERLRKVVNSRGKAGGAGGTSSAGGDEEDGGDTDDAAPTGLSVAHPMTGHPLPVFAASYVLDGYGTGAVIGVPAHDARDLALARRFGLPVTRVGAARPTISMNPILPCVQCTRLKWVSCSQVACDACVVRESYAMY